MSVETIAKTATTQFGRWAALIDPIRRLVSPGIDRVLRRFDDEKESEKVDFVAEADVVMMRQEPIRARILVRTLLVAVILFIVWAAFAPVEELARGEGRVVPAKQLQVLQSLDGGIVIEILAKEGEVVGANQVLVRIDPTRAVSSVRENRSQFLALQAKAARLKALAEGRPFVAPQAVLKEDPQLLAEEQRLFEARRNELDSAIAGARQQIAGKRSELAEARAKQTEAARAFELASQELSVTRPLIAKGAVSEVELLRLERDVARFRGERDQAAAQIERSQAAIAESTHRSQEIEMTFRNESGKELAETQSRLGQLTEGNIGLADRVKQAEIRSPLRGTVKRLLVNTVGGVVQPGKDIVEIVPLDDSLLVEAKVQPKDVAFLHPGQRAVVRLTAYDYSKYGGLEGKVELIGADSVSDEKGNVYYVVRVRTYERTLGKDLPIIPGMVAEVDIVTGQKSFLSYMMKPVLRAKHLAFTER